MTSTPNRAACSRLMIVHGANPHLHQTLRQFVFHVPRKWAGVRIRIASEIVIELGMSIEVKNAQRRVLARYGFSDRVSNGMIAAQRKRTKTLNQKSAT